MRKLLAVRLLFLLIAFISGCAETVEQIAIEPHEQIRRDNEAGKQLYKTFESGMSVVTEADANVYLRSRATELIAIDPVLKDSPIGVFMIRDRDKVWKNAGLPGIRVYLSLGFLKSVEYETVLAAAIAFELAHVRERHVISHLENSLNREDIDFFGPRGVLHFSDKEQIKAIQTAIKLLYDANYDPRGLIQLWEQFRQNASSSPYPPALLEKYKSETYRVIANHVPLRNPIVRTDRFVHFQKRVRGL